MGGSGGSLTKGPTVKALGGIKCQRVQHDCTGWHGCSQADTSQFAEYQRFGNDFKTFQALYEANNKANAQESETPLGIATA